MSKTISKAKLEEAFQIVLNYKEDYLHSIWNDLEGEISDKDFYNMVARTEIVIEEMQKGLIP